MICLIYQVGNEGGVSREKIDHRVKRVLRKCVFVCVVGGECMLTIFYSPQAPMKRVWNALLPQINIREQCCSLCERQIMKRQIIFETCQNQPWVLTLGQNEFDHFLVTS